MLLSCIPSRRLTWCVVLAAVALSGCVGLPEALPGTDKHVRFSPDDFDTASMHTRHLNASQARTCEAARRALLSQGYLVNTATDELVTGRKFFQPSNDTHYEVEMRVVCAPEGDDNRRTAAYASALQDRYVVKKVNNSASLGVGAIGSVSLPVSSSEDTLVKVGSETVSDPKFYDRFFQLFDNHVAGATRRHTRGDVLPAAAAAFAQEVDAEAVAHSPASAPASAPVSTPVPAPEAAAPVETAPVRMPEALPVAE